MAQKFTGSINLSQLGQLVRTYQSLVKTKKNGEKIIYFTIGERKAGPDQFGNTHFICVQDKDNNVSNPFFGQGKFFETDAKTSNKTISPAQFKGRGDDLPFGI